MIKFLQKIRQQLLTENKFSKYLLYAVGEIILVVIGILIALSINNWNENRINNNKETDILANIHKEFKQNKKQLDSVVYSHRKAYHNCIKIKSLFPIRAKPEATVLDSLSVQLYNSYGGVTFNPSQTSINALSSSSSFNIIKNEKLRDLLISWKDLILDYQEEEESSSQFMTNHYDPYFSKHFDYYFNFKDERNNFDALHTLEFEYLVHNRLDLLDQILNATGELQKVQETLNQIIALTKPLNN